MMSKINEKLWREEITNQMVNSLTFGKAFYSTKKYKFIDSIERHKYFAFRVPNLEEAENNPEQLKDFAEIGARGLARAIEKDIAEFIRDVSLPEDVPCDFAEELLKFLHDKNVRLVAVEGMRVQGAYDLDYLSTSVLGDYKYTIGIVDED